MDFALIYLKFYNIYMQSAYHDYPPYSSAAYRCGSLCRRENSSSSAVSAGGIVNSLIPGFYRSKIFNYRKAVCGGGNRMSRGFTDAGGGIGYHVGEIAGRAFVIVAAFVCQFKRAEFFCIRAFGAFPNFKNPVAYS